MDRGRDALRAGDPDDTGAVGAGIREGTLVKILGTSTCDLMISPTDRPLADIPGVCGIVEGSDPDEELAETQAKLVPMVNALLG